LRRYGVQVVHDEASAVDTTARAVKLARGGELKYDRLIVSPGIDFHYDQIAGYEAAMRDGRVLHAWKAGPQTVALQRQLAEMRDGGVYVLAVPLAPYRCPPGPYERASQVANYFKKHKPRAKVLIVDANPDVSSKGKLFKQAWADLYPGMIEFRGNSKAVGVDARAGVVKTEVDEVKGDVLNVVPAQRAGDIAVQAGLITANARWCGVDWRTTESTAVKGVHVLGDATLSAPGMPKSGSMANQQAKVCAAAVVAMLNGREPIADPRIVNTCYSYVSDDEVVHVASVHQLDESGKTFVAIKGAGGLSPARNALEGKYAWHWAQNIWADALG
jgi:NADPH-dependent 2,4-dienoyl-CoA reductase/sulfur reductase-like enzyme